MRLIKYPLIFLLIILFIVTLLCINIVFSLSVKKRKFIANTVTLYSKLALILLGIKVTMLDNERGNSNGNYLILVNHLSYVDILVVGSFFPSVFVTSLDTTGYFFPFLFTKLTHTLFVDRRSKAGLQKEINHIGEILKQGFNVVLFPEATSSNGETVLPFKSSLIKSAVIVEKDIKPICIRYNEINKMPVSVDNQDSIFWYGNMPFFSHLMKLLWLKNIQVELTVLDDILVNKYSSRKVISNKAYESIFYNYHGKFSLERFRCSEAVFV